MRKIILVLFAFLLSTWYSYSYSPWETFYHFYNIKNNFSCGMDITRVKKCYDVENVSPAWASVFSEVWLRWSSVTSSENEYCYEYDPDYIVPAGTTDSWWDITFFTNSSIDSATVNSSFEFSFSIDWNCTDDGSITTSFFKSTLISGWGWDTYRCNDIEVSWNTVKCIWNPKVLSFWLICDTTETSEASDIEQFKGFSVDSDNNNYASFECDTINKPICYVYNSNATSYQWQAWRTSPACQWSDGSCWNWVIEWWEQCERAIDSAWNLWDFPDSCNQNTCQMDLTTYSNQGDIEFGWVYDMVIWHNDNLSELNDQVYMINNSDYTFSNDLFNEICVTEAWVYNSDWTERFVNTWDSITTLWSTKCSGLSSHFYPEQKVFLDKTFNDIIADKDKVDGDDYEDNNLVVTIKTNSNVSPYSQILNWSDHLTSKFRVRVAKPAVQTTGATSFTKTWVSSDSNKIAEEWGINLEWWESNDLKNNNDVWVGTKSSSFENTVSTTNTWIIEEAEEYSVDSSDVIYNDVIPDSIDVDSLSDITDNYNWLPNVFIIKNADVSLWETNLDLDESTTYIIDWWDLNISWNIYSNQNIAFVLRSGWDINIWQDVTEIAWTYIVIPDSMGNWKINWEESDNQLLVKWSLYWDLSNLIDNRYRVTENNWELSFGTVVSFWSKVFQKPAPMVTSFINTYLSSSKVAN